MLDGRALQEWDRLMVSKTAQSQGKDKDGKDFFDDIITLRHISLVHLNKQFGYLMKRTNA